MMPLTITTAPGEGVTVLSNYFIDEYMKDANDAQLKVYLYLLRMVSSGLSTDVTQIADKFNHTEKDVLRALSFWEKRHLLSIDYDDNKNITGIRLCNPPSLPSGTGAASRAVAESAPKAILTKTVAMDYEKAKNTYTLEDISTFKDNPESSQLLFAAQQYLKRTISGSDIKTLLFIYDRLGFALDLTDYLLQYCIEQGENSFRDIEQTAIQWYEAGITNINQAKTFLKAKSRHADKNLSLNIMKLLGKQGLPAKKEQEYIDLWTIECAYPMDLIEEACNRTVIAVDRNRFAYANSILESWEKNQIHSVRELQTAGSQKPQSSPARRNTSVASEKKTGTFCQIEQHDYDFAALEKALTGSK